MLQKLTLILTMLCFSLITQIGFSDDWPQWGGPQQDLVWRETGIVKTLPTSGLLPRVWSASLGEGYSGPAVAEVNSRWCVFVTDRIFKQRVSYERVQCLDAESGKQIWEYEYPVEYSVSYPAGPRSTPVIDSNRVYTLGAQGHLFCFDAQNGKVLWSKNFVEDYGTRLPIWGMVASPLIDGKQLIMLVGGKQNSLVVSFDKASGKELWRSLSDPTVGYAPPTIFEFGGKRELIVWHPTAVSALEPETGKLIWEVPYGVRSGLSIATPRKVGNRLFVASFYNGPRMIEVSDDGKNAKIVWSGNSDSEKNTDGLHPIMMTPVFNGAHIYGVCSYGQLRCLDASNGRRLWETEKATGKGRWWNAFIIPHEDRYFLHNEQGDLIIANLTPKGYEEISRAKLIEPTRRVQRRMTIWSHPAFALKSVFARNDKEIVRVDLSAK
ncbi:PQQ-binding-like beta-propeller repeat protein [Gimesia aquarii]|uniref:Quinohemoprotein alcohol dehydrogenase ADH IIB n=1 Tax=Gimesia aquarii TaxID=2527964 RepID=A0A517WNU3_9PLAN|nr:PQQ-binding-like beta-propeller repeat protein [Gimesia aquarii]QDU06906.1 Quinohemoprotein alcohol dehydrogenase ADH IIB precursor [Gimesia aquarii]